MSKHEANLVFAIGLQLLFKQVPFELEWASKVGRHDIAIKNESRIYGIIEVKHEETEGTSQLYRYKSLGVPLVVAHWKSDINKLVDEAAKWTLEKGMSLKVATGKLSRFQMLNQIAA